MNKSKDANIEETVENLSATVNQESVDTEELKAKEDINVSATTENENQDISFDVPTAINTIIARTEAIGIVVSVINATIDILQKRDIKLTEEELAKLQSTINSETEKTDDLYRRLEQVLNPSNNPVIVDVDSKVEENK